MNLIEKLQSEKKRCQELLEIYKTIPSGVFAAMMIKKEIELAEKAMAESDTVEMIRCCKRMEGFKD